MNIGFIGNDQELSQQLRQIPQVDAVFSLQETAQMDLIKETFKSTDLVLLSDRLVQPHELEGIAEILQDKKLLYLMSNKADAAVTEETALVCKRLRIEVNRPKRTVNQIVDYIQQRYMGVTQAAKTGGQVIALVGSQSQSGVTASTFSLAEAIGKRMDRKVAVIGLNAFSPGDSFLTYAGSYLNDLYTQIKDGGILTPIELVAHMNQAKHFSYLAGNADPTKRYRYTSESVAHVIACAREAFDVVLLDAGSNPDNNLCLQALLHADLRILVTTQQPAALLNWQRSKPILQMVTQDHMSFMLLINKWSKQWGDTKEIGRSLELPMIGWLPDLKDDGLLCEMERRLLTTVEHPKYMDQLQRMADLLQSRFGWPVRNEATKLPWFKRRAAQ
ncbi:AAA family ATPase [Paenibacillus sinopodophylli]|uniref:AAA family ATPase n=1 Tax=Paenibacillus sinopodophylli TaxID=1837342 RepID=UPI00110D092C|nr:hypothetical protein [Paenibacillus sinopodophylli]